MGSEMCIRDRPSAVPGGNLCRDGPLPRLTALSLPRPGRWDEQRALEDDAKRNLAATRHDSKTERGALIRLSVGYPTRREGRRFQFTLVSFRCGGDRLP